MREFAIHLVYVSGKRAGQAHTMPLCMVNAMDENDAIEVFNRDYRPEIERKGKEINHFQVQEVKELVDIFGD